MAARDGPARTPTAARRPTTTPSTSCCARSAACRARCRRSIDCEPVLDYGRQTASVDLHRARLPPGHARAGRRRHQADPDHRHAAGVRGRAGRRPHPAQGGRRPLRRAVLGRQEPPLGLRRRLPAAGLDRPPLAALAGPRPVPRPPVAQLPAAQRADAQGPHLRTDRRDRGRRDHVAARDARAANATTTTASPGSATPRSPCGGCTPSASTGRRSTSSPSSPMSPTGDDDLQIMYGIGGERELHEYELDHLAGLRQLAAGPDRQRRVRAAAARRLGRAARLGVPARQGRRPPRRPDLADPAQAGQRGAQALARTRRRNLGGARPATSTSRRRRSCAGSPSTAGRSSPR